MSKVFDKDIPTIIDIYDKEIETWEASSDNEKMAMAVNLRCDHRVTTTREEHFRHFFLKHNNLRKALDDYARRHVKFTSLPHFCEPWCDNSVVECLSGVCCEHFDMDTDLVTVMSLNGLLTPIMDTYPHLEKEVPEWIDILDIDTHASDRFDRFDNWLENNLKGKPLKQIETFLSTLFKVLNHRLTEENQHYNPVWVTTWPNFVEAVEMSSHRINPDRWSQVVGVPRDTPTWQIVLKYPASKVKCLHRPSQLDGGYYPQHFPSPPEAMMASGGHTMDLGMSGNKLLNEYIHKQIELDINYWRDAGELIGKTSFTPEDLPQMRNKHYEKLTREYEEVGIKHWMPKPL